MAPFKGVIPVLPTPFTPDGDVDDDSFLRVIDAAIADGADALAMFGLASEYYKLSDSERAHLVRLLVQHAAKRCPVIISITPHATKLAVGEARQAVEAGADALMIAPPFFLAPGVDSIVQHIREVARAAAVPILVQYAPLQTGRWIDPWVFHGLQQEIQNLASVKVDLVPSGPTISALRSLGVDSLVGYMGLHLPEDFSRGVNGVMPSVSVCRFFVEIWKALDADRQKAWSLHGRILPLLTFMMQSIEGLIACEKELLCWAGILRSSYRRSPSCDLDGKQLGELRRLASSLGMPGSES